ncbi:MAG: adenylate kinase [Bacteroidota bacterium]
MLNLVLFGPPGSGKGTQSARVAGRFNLVHLSTGEIFREEVRKGTRLGKQLIGFMKEGVLVPDAIVLKKLYKIALQYRNAAGLVFDGFPRTLHQAVILDKLLEKKNIPINIVFCMVVDEDELVRRMIGRSEDSGRCDDKENVIRKRMQVYREQTLPLKEYYAKQNKLSNISGMAPVKQVAGRIARVVEHYLAQKEIVSMV